MNAIEGLQQELERNKELLKQYEELPIQSGFFGVAVLKEKIKRGEKAMVSGDVVEMLSAYRQLKDSE